jgi:hypothetical protein
VIALTSTLSDESCIALHERDRASRDQESTVIWESGPWKDLLLTDSNLLERWCAKTSVTERRSMLIERKVFLAAYTIRKLCEAQNLSTSFRDQSLRCRTYPAISGRITHHSVGLDKLYNFGDPEERVIVVRDLIDLIIHSFVFSEFLGEDLRVEGFLVTSDRKRHERLWLVEIKTFIDLMRQVGSDYPSTMTGVFNRDKNDWELWQGHGDPPADFVRRAKKILQDQWMAGGRREHQMTGDRAALANSKDGPSQRPSGVR